MAKNSKQTERKAPEQLTDAELALIRRRCWLAAKKFHGAAYGELDVPELADYAIFYILDNLNLIPLPIIGSDRGALIYTIAYRKICTRFNRSRIGPRSFASLAIDGALIPKDADRGRGDPDQAARFWVTVDKILSTFQARDRELIARAVIHSERPKRLAKEYGVSLGNACATIRKFKALFRTSWTSQEQETTHEET